MEHIGEPYFRDFDGERLNLAGPQGFDSVPLTGLRKTADAVE